MRLFIGLVAFAVVSATLLAALFAAGPIFPAVPRPLDARVFNASYLCTSAVGGEYSTGTCLEDVLREFNGPITPENALAVMNATYLRMPSNRSTGRDMSCILPFFEAFSLSFSKSPAYRNMLSFPLWFSSPERLQAFLRQAAARAPFARPVAVSETYFDPAFVTNISTLKVVRDHDGLGPGAEILSEFVTYALNLVFWRFSTRMAEPPFFAPPPIVYSAIFRNRSADCLTRPDDAAILPVLDWMFAGRNTSLTAADRVALYDTYVRQMRDFNTAAPGCLTPEGPDQLETACYVFPRL